MGLITGALSLLRQARVFHPSGTMLFGQVQSVEGDFPPYAWVRFSAALWRVRKGERESGLPDVLGCAVRFTHRLPQVFLKEEGACLPSVYLSPADQDLLFATIRYPWTMGLSPFFTEVHDYLSNLYFGVSPFQWRGSKLFYLRLRIQAETYEKKECREETLLAYASRSLLVIERAEKGFWFRRSEWAPVCEIKLKREMQLDQAALRFSAFQNGVGIRPRGFVHYLRKGAYGASQACRPEKTK